MPPREVVVTGLGLLSPLGDTPEALHEALLAGEVGIKPIELFDPSLLTTKLGGEIRPFEPQRYLGERNLRPLDRTSRLLISAATRALEDAGWTEEARNGRELSLAVGTTYCSMHTIGEFDRRGLKLGPNYVSPFDFANSVINAAAGQTAIWHKLAGVNSTLAGGEASGLQAIAYGADLIRTGQADMVLAGGVEELCFESSIAYSRAGRLAGGEVGSETNGRPVPFDRARDGFAPGEGAGLLVLEAAEVAEARGAKIHARIAGSGAAFAPDRNGDFAAALSRAIRAAWTSSGAEGGAFLCVSSGASGARELDAWEAEGIARGLEAAGVSGLPVTAIKANLGEALGASGAFQAMSLIATLADGRIPGIAGLESTDPGFPLTGVSAASRAFATAPGTLALATAICADGPVMALLLAAP
ncbi:MAG: beta-ketoacyl synthase N-terminal-like domain-containing protein [Acidobacteriota bacterium]